MAKILLMAVFLLVFSSPSGQAIRRITCPILPGPEGEQQGPGAVSRTREPVPAGGSVLLFHTAAGVGAPRPTQIAAKVVYMDSKERRGVHEGSC